MLTLECDLWVPAPLDQVWDFARNPANLAGITPAAYGCSVQAPDEMVEGSTVLITLRPLGLPIPVRWVSKIHDIVSEGPRRQFVDVQASGPFAHWKHTHIFEEGTREFHGKRTGHDVKVTEPGTWILDRVEYRMPMGFLGDFAHSIFARKNLEGMFAYRQRKIAELFSGVGQKP